MAEMSIHKRAQYQAIDIRAAQVWRRSDANAELLSQILFIWPAMMSDAGQAVSYDICQVIQPVVAYQSFARTHTIYRLPLSRPIEKRTSQAGPAS